MTATEQTLHDSVTVLYQGTEELGGKLRQVVKYIVDNEIPRDRVRLIFQDVGFPEPRISEYATIAYGDEESRQKYLQGKIGWRPALEMAKDSKAKNSGKKANRSPSKWPNKNPR